MASSASTEGSLPELVVAWFTVRGVCLTGPQEWDLAYLTLDSSVESWEAVTVLRNGVALPVTLRHLGGQVRVTVEWPRSSPGTYQLVVTSHVGPAALSVTLHARKLSPGGFEAMLEDLHLHLPADVALSLKRAGGLAGITLSALKPATPEEELARLRRAVNGTPSRPGLAALLPVIARRPHEVLQAYAVSVRRELVKRPHPATLVQALSRAGTRSDQGVLDRASRLPDERVRPSVDVYENRVVRVGVHFIRQRLRALRHLAARRSHLLAPVQQLTATLDSALRQAPFLHEVRDLSSPPTRLTMVLLKRPEYRAVLEIILELQRSVRVTLEDQRLLEPLENAPALYQTWCTLQVIQALTEACAAAGFILTEDRLAVLYSGTLLLHVLPDGKPLLTFGHPADGRTITLTSERRFGTSSPGWHSVSFSQQPDLVLEFRQPGTLPELWVLDPKYKLNSEGSSQAQDGAVPKGRPKKEDIDKMHAYRDAIRDADGCRGVRFAAILYPGSDQQFGPGLQAISAQPLQAGSLRETLRLLFEKQLQTSSSPDDHTSGAD